MHIPYSNKEPDPYFNAVDRIFRQQKEARAAAESKAKESQNTTQRLPPSGVGVKQIAGSESHGMLPQYEPAQTTDNLGKPPSSPTSNLNAFQNLKRTMGAQLETLTALGRGPKGLAPPSPQTPSSLDNLSGVGQRPTISRVSSPGQSSRSNPAVTPLSHICESIVVSRSLIALDLQQRTTLIWLSTLAVRSHRISCEIGKECKKSRRA